MIDEIIDYCLLSIQILLTGVFLLAPELALSQETCRAPENYGRFDSVKNESDLKMLKAVEIEYSKSNIHDFCRRNLQLRYLNSRNLPPENCNLMSLENLEHTIDDDMRNRKGSNNWDLALMSTAFTRKNLISESEMSNLELNFGSLTDFNSLSTEVKLYVLTSINDTNKFNATIEKKFNSVKGHKIKKTILCIKEVGLSSLGDCLRAFDLVEAQML
ncbi:MAG: hypothetical protein ABL927_14125, partial [Bdellovibrionales bacterium]